MIKPARIVLALVALLSTSFALATCSERNATPTPVSIFSTATPTTTLSVPTPTPHPPTESEALAAARMAVSSTDSYHFSLQVKDRGIPQMGATGTWIAPNSYDVTLSLPVCPPPVPSTPGMPSSPDSTALVACDLFPTYQAVNLEGALYSRLPGGIVGARGDWVPLNDLNPYGLSFLNENSSPVKYLLDTVELYPGSTMSEKLLNGALAYEIVARATSGTSTSVRIEQNSYDLLSLAIASGDSTQEWTFTRHNEPLAVKRPVANDARDPIEWLAYKTVRLIENSPLFDTASLRPFSKSSDAMIVESFISALSAGTTVPQSDFQKSGRVLTVHFTDGTRFSLSQARAISTGQPVADHWYVRAESTVVVRSPELTDWWSNVPAYFAPVETVTWPDIVAVDSSSKFSGRGWPSEIVTLSIIIDGNKVEFGKAQTTTGVWEWEGYLPSNLQPGLVEVTITGNQQAIFVHTSASKKIVARWPSGFSIHNRHAEVIYTSVDSLALTNGDPLWAENPEDHDSIRELLVTINNAPRTQAPLTEVDQIGALHIGHPDGTETLLRFAGDCGVLTKTTGCSDNRWVVSHITESATQISPAQYYIDAPSLSSWWRQRAATKSLVELLVVPALTTPSIYVSGEGWPAGEGITIQVVHTTAHNKNRIVTIEEILEFGSYFVRINLPQLLPGQLEVIVTGQGLNSSSATRAIDYP